MIKRKLMKTTQQQYTNRLSRLAAKTSSQFHSSVSIYLLGIVIPLTFP